MVKRIAHKAVWLILAAIVVVNIAGCNTIRGVGKDIQAGGRAIERAGQN